MGKNAILAAVSMVVVLAGCAGFDTTVDNRGSIFESGVFGDVRAKQPKSVSSEPQGLIPVDTGTGASQIFQGGSAAYSNDVTGATDGVEAGVDAGNYPAVDDTGSFRLNFENAEIKDVVHAVLGEALQLNYTITPDVAGTITISSARPVGRRQLLGILETSLAAQGYSLTRSGDVYKVGAITTGAGVVDRGALTQPGFGVSVIPLRFVSVKTMGRLLGGFVIDAEGIRIDSTSNTMVISGPGAKRQEVVDTILSFDEDWMQDQTVGIFELRRANPTAVVPELERIFDSAGSGSGVITFKPITRLKAVLAISRNPTLVRRAETWSRRLDTEGASGEQMVIYRAKHRDARELAKIASGLFAGGSLNFASGQQASGQSQGNDGFQIGADSQSGEEPIEDLAGATETDIEGNAEDTTQTGAEYDNTAPPDVLDLTTTSGGGRSAVKIAADPANNTVIIYGEPAIQRKVIAALQQLDIAPNQVAVSVTIAEVRLSEELRYGIEYYLRSGDDGSISFKELGQLPLRKSFPGFNFLIGSDKNPDVIIKALDDITDVEILSSPSLMVLENQRATLQVGDQIPIRVREQTTGNNGDQLINEIEYRDTGIILNFTPRVGDNGTVTMTVEQEISAVSEERSSSDDPTINRRRVASNIAVNDGQTVVLAGLISSRKSNGNSGLPILSRIPGVRDATGTNNKTANRNELIVLIRPQIVRNGEDAQSVAEDLRTRMWAIGNRERQSP
jgi:general secretion pathway protein D